LTQEGRPTERLSDAEVNFWIDYLNIKFSNT
jgi:hypothetical protein